MFPRSRRILVTLAATAEVASGAVAHAATGSSGSTADSTTAPAAVVAGHTTIADHAWGDCPTMGGDEPTPSTPSTTPSSDSSTSSTSTTSV